MSSVIELRPEGLYCPAGDFYVDPWRAVPRAVITHAHSDHARPGSGAYFCAEAGAGILRHRLHTDAITPLAYGEVNGFGRAGVSLHPAGHVLGSAQVRIEVNNHVWVISGDYKRTPDPSCTAFEPVGCDVFITEATFALPIYRWPSMAQVINEVDAFWSECAANGATAVVFCYALGKAQRLLAELYQRCPHRRDEVVLVHGAVEPITALYRAAGVTMLATEVLGVAQDEPVTAIPDAPAPRSGKRKSAGMLSTAGRLVIAPPAAAGSPWLNRLVQPKLAFASGWMQVRGVRRRSQYERGFVLSDHADWPGLIASIEQSGARKVLATHGNTEALVRYCNERNIDAVALRTELGGEN